MKFNFDLFIDLLWLGTLSGVISTICLQKLKNTKLLINHRVLYIIVHIFIGYSICRLFTNLSIKLSIATGVITWIGAETIYDKLKEKNIIASQLPIDDSLEESINENEEQSIEELPQ